MGKQNLINLTRHARWIALAVGGVLSPLAANAQLRVMSYNILNYPGSTAAARNPAFQAIISAADPHVIVAQEVPDFADAEAFRTNVLNVVHPNQWSIAPYVDGPDTNNALFYRSSRAAYVSGDSDSYARLTTALRDINRWKIRPAGYSSAAATFYVYSAHLASGGGEPAREAEAAILRNNANTLPAGTRFIAAGDFNIETSTEGAYQRLTEDQADDDGRFRDPQNPNNAVQNWRNNNAFRLMHTQSTRLGTLSPSDGGSTGGMDDRFDFALVSYQLYQTSPLGMGLCLIPNSYTPYGNDGNHYNLNINDPPTNTAVGQAIADALQRASDHLPVIISLQVPARGQYNSPLDFGRIITGGQSGQTLTVTNTAFTVTANGADSLIYTLSPPAGFSAPVGQFAEAPLGGFNSHAISMMVPTPGPIAAQLVVNSNDPEAPAANIALNGRVLRHAAPSLTAGQQTLAAMHDFGEHAANGFAPLVQSIHNVGFDVNQALLDWHDSTLAGADAGRFSITQRGDPALIGAGAGGITVIFIPTGAMPLVDYTAELRLHTRDESLPGSTVLADAVVTLRARLAAARGDLNLDGAVNQADLPLFINVLLGLDTDPTRTSLADVNVDGMADGGDIDPFIALIQ